MCSGSQLFCRGNKVGRCSPPTHPPLKLRDLWNCCSSVSHIAPAAAFVVSALDNWNSTFYYCAGSWKVAKATRRTFSLSSSATRLHNWTSCHSVTHLLLWHWPTFNESAGADFQLDFDEANFAARQMDTAAARGRTEFWQQSCWELSEQFRTEMKRETANTLRRVATTNQPVCRNEMQMVILICF